MTLIFNTTWKVNAPEGGANLHFFVPERKKVILKALLRKAFKITFQVVSLTHSAFRYRNAMSTFAIPLFDNSG